MYRTERAAFAADWRGPRLRGRRKADPTGMAACGQIPVGPCAHALLAAPGVGQRL